MSPPRQRRQRRPAAPPPAGLSPRRAAYQMLRQVAEGVPFDQARDHAVADLAAVDRRLAHELAAGVLRHRHELDARLEPLVHRGWSSVGAGLRDILRLGVYQLSLLDRIPPHAAVSTTVDLAREVEGETGARFANAILRGVGGRTAAPAAFLDPARALAEQYSHPVWIVGRWLARFGPEATAELLRWNNTRPQLAIQPARQSLELLQQHCYGQGVAARRAAHDAGLLVDGRPTDLPGFLQGDFVVQDPAQALVARFVDPPPGALVYDACAAPGGKTIALGRRAGRVVAGEVQWDRIARLRENLARAGSGNEFVIQATATAPPLRPLDVVLLDVPCLGTGTLARMLAELAWPVARVAVLLDHELDRRHHFSDVGWQVFEAISLIALPDPLLNILPNEVNE